MDLCFLAFGGSLGCSSATVFFPFCCCRSCLREPVLVVTLSGRSRDSVDPRLLNLSSASCEDEWEVLAHEIWTSRLFLSDFSVQLMVGGPVAGDEGFISEKSSSDISSASEVTIG